MKNIFNYKIMSLSFAFLALTSCNDDEASFEKSVKSIATISQTSVTMTEGQTVPLTVTLDRANNERSDLKIEVLSGSGTFRDFTVSYGTNAPSDIETTTDDGYGIIGYKLAVPAYSTTFTFDLNAVLDLNVEQSETLVLKLSSVGNANSVIAEGSELINVTINNGTANDLVTSLDWSKPFADAHGTIRETQYVGADNLNHGYCPFDFDMEVYDENFDLFDVDYDNCPAEVLIPANAPNGDYIVVPQFYTRAIVAGSVPKTNEIIFPAVLTVAKPGVFNYTKDMTGSFRYSTGGINDGNSAAFIPTVVVTKTGTNYVVSDFNTGDVLAQGKINNFIKSLQAKKTKKGLK